MTVLVVEKSRQVGLTLAQQAFAERLDRAVELLDDQLYGYGRHLLVAYATARLLGQDSREAMLQAHYGKDFREPRAGWNLPVLDRHGDALVKTFDAAVERIRAKAVRS